MNDFSHIFPPSRFKLLPGKPFNLVLPDKTNDPVITATCIEDGPTNDCPLTILLSRPWKFLFLSLRVEYIKNIEMSVTFATKSKIIPFSLAPSVLAADESTSDGETIGWSKEVAFEKGKRRMVR